MSVLLLVGGLIYIKVQSPWARVLLAQGFGQLTLPARSCSHTVLYVSCKDSLKNKQVWLNFLLIPGFKKSGFSHKIQQ